MKAGSHVKWPTLATAMACVALLGFSPDGRCADAVIVHAGHLLDVDAGRMLADQAVRIENGRVVAVAPWNAANVGGTRVIDWSAYTVLPGLMDMHTHLIGDLETNDPLAPLKMSAQDDVLLGASHARDTLYAGFTTVRDVGTYRALGDVALRDAIAKGYVPGPRMFCAGAYITIPGGGGEVTGLPSGTIVPPEFRRGVSASESEVRTNVDYLLDHGADFIKVIATGAVLTPGTEPGKSEFTEAEIHAAVEEAARHGTFVAAHAHGAEGIKNAVRAGVRSVEHGSLIDDEGIALMVQHGTWLVADIYNGDYIDTVGRAQGWPADTLRKNTETTETQREGFRKAVKAGVHIAFGTDAGVYPHGDNARQFAYMVKYGMTPLQAIQASTIEAAKLLRKEKELGSIAPGKSADMVAVAGDPLADIRLLEHVQGVVKQGALECGPGTARCHDASPPGAGHP
ncbi:MAG TPA: amidohydrolase family protein [Xanthomonadaceae bacterium]|jgi:imidazolonepropionase-like amidohydrolase